MTDSPILPAAGENRLRKVSEEADRSPQVNAFLSRPALRRNSSTVPGIFPMRSDGQFARKMRPKKGTGARRARKTLTIPATQATTAAK